MKTIIVLVVLALSALFLVSALPVSAAAKTPNVTCWPAPALNWSASTVTGIGKGFCTGAVYQLKVYTNLFKDYVLKASGNTICSYNVTSCTKVVSSSYSPGYWCALTAGYYKEFSFSNWISYGSTQACIQL